MKIIQKSAPGTGIEPGTVLVNNTILHPGIVEQQPKKQFDYTLALKLFAGALFGVMLVYEPKIYDIYTIVRIVCSVLISLGFVYLLGEKLK